MSGRSNLFVPGNRPERFEKAWNSGADTVILDLEDAVPSQNKTEAREEVSTWLSPERPAYVRVNGASTEWFRPDLEAIAGPGLAGIVLPKAEETSQITEVISLLPREIRVLPLLETGLGVWNARELAEAPHVDRLVFGSIDLQLDIGIDEQAEELLYARSHLVLASRVAKISPPVDGVTTVLDDTTRLEIEIDRARRLGFGGKLCIHPQQIEAINQGFMPSQEEISWAGKVLEAIEASGDETIRLEGEMIDRPVIERARMLLARAGY